MGTEQMVSLLVGFALVMATLGGGDTPATAHGLAKDTSSRAEQISLDVPDVDVWATAQDSLSRPTHRAFDEHPYGESLETERELDDDSERVERLTILIALAAHFAPIAEPFPADPDVAPCRTTHLASVRTSRGPPLV